MATPGPFALVSFRLGQHIRIIDPEHPMTGKAGRVSRIRFSHRDHWVAMVDLPPDELRAFPADDPYGRGYHILLYPDQCISDDGEPG